MFQSNFRLFSTLDWGVPLLADAQEMLADAEKRITERKNDPDAVKKDKATDKQTGKPKTGLEAEIARLEEDTRVNEESITRIEDAEAVYAKCVIANNLPPTAK